MNVEQIECASIEEADRGYDEQISTLKQQEQQTAEFLIKAQGQLVMVELKEEDAMKVMAGQKKIWEARPDDEAVQTKKKEFLANVAKITEGRE